MRIDIDTSNAAFDGDSGGSEVARILRWLADRMDQESIDELSPTFGILYDINGNRVGQVTL